MPVSLREVRSSVEGRRWMERVFPEYVDSLTAGLSHTGKYPVFSEGGYQSDLLSGWFKDDSSIPLVLMKQDRPVGFAVIAKPAGQWRSQVDYRMSEFFIIASSRRLGVGREAAELIFKRFAGRWEIVENATNKNSIAFWRSVVRACSAGQFRERIENGEVRQYFDSSPMRPTPR